MDQVLKMPRYETVEAAARSLANRDAIADRRRRVATRSESRQSAPDAALELFEQHQLAPTELRILLALLDGELALPKIAKDLGLTATEARSAAARLYVRDLLRWRELDDRTTVLEIKPTGRAMLRRLLMLPGHIAPR